MAGERRSPVSVKDVRPLLEGFQQVVSPGCSPRMWRQRLSGQPIIKTPTAAELDVLAAAAVNVINAFPQLREGLPSMLATAYPPRVYRPVGAEGLIGGFQTETTDQAMYCVANALVEGVERSLEGKRSGGNFLEVARRLRRGLHREGIDESMGVHVEFRSGSLDTSLQELQTLAAFSGVFGHLRNRGLQALQSPVSH